MATNYSTLGMQLMPTPAYGTQQTATSGPQPSSMPLFPIGTGRAAGTSSVGTTVDRDGDEEKYTGTTDVTQIDPITSAPVDPNKSYPDGIKGWIQDKVDYALAPTVEYNRVTGSYRASGPGGGITGMMGPLGGMVQGMAEISRANLENIAEQAFKGSSEHAVGYLNGQIVGVSPGLGGYSVLSGNLPQGMSVQQQQAVAQSLKGLQNKAGAYTTYVDENNIPSQETYDIFSTYGGQGRFDSRYSDASTAVATTARDYKVGKTTYSPASYDYSPTSYEPSGSASSTDGPSSRDSGGGYEGGASGGTNEGQLSEEALGGRIGLAPGGRADGPGSESEGHSSHGFDGGRSDAGREGSGNNSGDRISQRVATSEQIGHMIQNSIQSQSMTPEERYASNAAMMGKTPDIETIDRYKEAGISVGSKTTEEPKGFGASIGETIGGAITAIGQYGALGALGLVPFREGGDVTKGFVNKDPDSVSEAQSIADNRYTSVKAGSFVVNQPANEANEKRLDKIVADASKTAKMKKGGKAGMVDVALSDGERLIEPEVVAEIEKKHGKNFLDNLNDKGKSEVKRRQAKYGEKIGAALGGGFLADQGMELGDVGEDIPMEEYLPVSDELKAKLSKFANRKPQRGQIKSFIKDLSPEEKLTVLFLTETQSTTDPIESMEAIGEVVKNRIGSDYYDFKDIKTLDDALLKQTRKGAFHFSGLEPSTLYARAKEVKKGVADKGLAKAYAAAQNVLDPETEGQYRLPAGTVFYTRKDAPSQWMRESKDLEFSTELGGHEFYRTFASPELP
jgi:hypothetical protein